MLVLLRFFILLLFVVPVTIALHVGATAAYIAGPGSYWEKVGEVFGQLGRAIDRHRELSPLDLPELHFELSFAPIPSVDSDDCDRVSKNSKGEDSPLPGLLPQPMIGEFGGPNLVRRCDSEMYRLRFLCGVCGDIPDLPPADDSGTPIDQNAAQPATRVFQELAKAAISLKDVSTKIDRSLKDLDSNIQNQGSWDLIRGVLENVIASIVVSMIFSLYGAIEKWVLGLLLGL